MHVILIVLLALMRVTPDLRGETVTPVSVQVFEGTNADWTPVEHEFDGIIMVQVPAGCFIMGAGETGEGHEICFDAPFWIDRTEVTQADFARLDGEKAHPHEFSGNSHPVENITWFEARDFCELRGARLPTEAEWEYAARGPDNSLYPWGNEWDEEKLIWDWYASQGTAEVGSHPEGASWVGTLDMSGNVWEWTSSLYMPYPYDENDSGEEDTGDRDDVFRVLRGGSWFNLRPEHFTTAFREWHRPDHFDITYGFRCVHDFEAEE